MKEKYTRHYRRMIGPVLESIVFRSSNRFQPVIEALGIIKRTLKLKGNYFHEPVPIPGIVTRNWESLVFEEVRGDQLVVRKFYELCVLQTLERALKCKEIWAEGALSYRNPDEDMPKDWENPQRRSYYYSALKQPLDAKSFIDPLRKRLADALRSFDAALPNCKHLRIKDGKFSLSKLKARPESTNINAIKDAILSEYGMIDLLDLFVTADRLTNFTANLVHTGVKEVRTREQLRPLIILNIFAEGTNVGVKRLARANRFYDYSDLLYVRKTYFTPEALRNAITAVTNKILRLRNPEIWGQGNACASDGKAFESWDQNLLSEWRTRHKGYGVVVYWHVEKGAICIYSQLKNFSSSEVAAMIEGLIRHQSEANIDRNYVDSHGQSLIAFAFSRLLNRFRLMPRLKRIKDQRLYLPGPGSASAYPNLAGVFARPARWDWMEQQYDEMIKAITAVTEGTASTEAVMRRYNSYNQTHPTFKALKDLGKVEKTIYLCEYLPSREMQYEVNTGLNVVENWNATNQFLHYAKEGEFASNDRESNLVATLCLHLLQNCMILVNTLIIEKVLQMKGMVKSARTEDFRGISPLIHSHINPFGRFELDFNKPLIVEVA